METLNETAMVFGRAFAELVAERREVEAAIKDLQAAREAFALPEMERFFAHPLVPKKAKLELLDRVFGGAQSGVFLPFLKVVVLRRREKFLRSIIRAALYRCLELKGMAVVSITSAGELDEGLKARLVDRLAAYFGRPVYPEFRVNPRLLGGVVIRYEDRVLDLSVLGRLEEMEERLLARLKGGEG